MAGAGVLSQPVISLADIIRLVNRLPLLAGKAVLSGSANHFYIRTCMDSAGVTVDNCRTLRSPISAEFGIALFGICFNVFQKLFGINGFGIRRGRKNRLLPMTERSKASISPIKSFSYQSPHLYRYITKHLYKQFYSYYKFIYLQLIFSK